jgi:hypothetical protein
MNVEIGRQNIIILLGRAVSFLGIHKSEPDIYIGFSEDPSFAVWFIPMHFTHRCTKGRRAYSVD